MRLEHSFDWRGFSFSGKLVVLCFSMVLAGQYGLPYAQAHFSSRTSPASVAAGSVVPAGSSFSSSTPRRVISSLTIEDAAPQSGKFIAADLVGMKLYLYQDGNVVAEYPILTKGRPGSPYETPAGFYSVLTKEESHLNKRAEVYMPYSMQFYGNYFIHGWPYHVDGTPVDPNYSGGCIRLGTADAMKVYVFAEKGTGLFVYDPGRPAPTTSVALNPVRPPTVSAASYLVADIDTGDVLLEHNAGVVRPIASVTKLMTALVANETIMFDKEISVEGSTLSHSGASGNASSVGFSVGDLLYPLLMESNNAIAVTLAEYYGADGFVGWMNTSARALGMTSTSYEDPSGISAKNVSTTDDLFRLAAYLTNKKSFIWDVTRTPSKTLTAVNGSSYAFRNFNQFSDRKNFVGGKVGYTEQAQKTMVSVFNASLEGEVRHIAVIVLKSADYNADTMRLVDWFTQSARPGTAVGAACASCATISTYRKIPLEN